MNTENKEKSPKWGFQAWFNIALFIFLSNYLPPLAAAVVMMVGTFVVYIVGALVISLFVAEKSAPAIPSDMHRQIS